MGKKGRKQMSEEQKLNRVYHIRVQEEMMSEVEQAAEKVGCKPSEAVRACVMAVVYADRTSKALGRALRDAVVEYRTGETEEASNG